MAIECQILFYEIKKDLPNLYRCHTKTLQKTIGLCEL